MLAQLDKALDPAIAFVDREGNVLKIIGSSSTGKHIDETVVEKVAELGFFATPADDPPSYIPRWFNHEQIDELSVEEARILAGRFMGELGNVESLAKMHRQAAKDLIEATLVAGFRKAASTGEIDLATFIPPDTTDDRLSPADRELLLGWLAERSKGHST